MLEVKSRTCTQPRIAVLAPLHLGTPRSAQQALSDHCPDIALATHLSPDSKHQRLNSDQFDAGIRCAEDLLELDAGDLEDEVQCLRECVHDKEPTVPVATARKCSTPACTCSRMRCSDCASVHEKETQRL